MREIRRRTRRKFSPEEKIRIVNIFVGQDLGDDHNSGIRKSIEYISDYKGTKTWASRYEYTLPAGHIYRATRYVGHPIWYWDLPRT